MSARAEHGFTLLEVLVSVAIMAAIITFAFRAFRDIQDAYERVSGSMHRDRAARVLLDRIESELVGTTMVQRVDGADPLLHPFVFVSSDATLGQEGSDSVRFVTQTPIRAPGAESHRGLMLVTYGVESETVDVHNLFRSEEPLPRQAESDIRLDDAQLVADEVAGFQLRFRGLGQEWSPGWNSTAAEELDEIPDTVEVTVRLWERDAKGELVEGGGLLHIKISDIGAKLNLNALIDAQGERREQSKEFLKAALRQITVTTPRLLEEGPITDEKVDDLADGILDWLDSDDATRLGTPEEEYYVGIKKADSAPVDRPVFSLDELAPIPGMDPLLLEAMKAYFTTLPLFPAANTGGINLNTAPAHVLGLLYHGAGLEYELTHERNILEILRVRSEGRIFCQDTSDERCVTAADALGVISESEVYFPPLQNRSNFFQIEIEASYGDARSCVTSIVDRGAEPRLQTVHHRMGC